MISTSDKKKEEVNDLIKKKEVGFPTVNSNQIKTK
jgi:hypothetical protein